MTEGGAGDQGPKSVAEELGEATQKLATATTAINAIETATRTLDLATTKLKDARDELDRKRGAAADALGSATRAIDGAVAGVDDAATQIEEATRRLTGGSGPAAPPPAPPASSASALPPSGAVPPATAVQPAPSFELRKIEVDALAEAAVSAIRRHRTIFTINAIACALLFAAAFNAHWPWARNTNTRAAQNLMVAQACAVNDSCVCSEGALPAYSGSATPTGSPTAGEGKTFPSAKCADLAAPSAVPKAVASVVGEAPEKVGLCVLRCAAVEKARDEVKVNREAVWKDLFRIQVPILGVTVGADDLTLLGSLALTVMALWGWFAARREWTVAHDVNRLTEELKRKNEPEAFITKLHHTVVLELIFAPVRMLSGSERADAREVREKRAKKNVGVANLSQPNALRSLQLPKRESRRPIIYSVGALVVVAAAVALIAHPGEKAKFWPLAVAMGVPIVLLFVFLGLSVKYGRAWAFRSSVAFLQSLAPATVVATFILGDVHDLAFVPATSIKGAALIESLSGEELAEVICRLIVAAVLGSVTLLIGLDVRTFAVRARRHFAAVVLRELEVSNKDAKIDLWPLAADSPEEDVLEAFDKVTPSKAREILEELEVLTRVDDDECVFVTERTKEVRRAAVTAKQAATSDPPDFVEAIRAIDAALPPSVTPAPTPASPSVDFAASLESARTEQQLRSARAELVSAQATSQSSTAAQSGS